MELVSLRCNRDFTSASSCGLGWYKYAIATQWYQFHTTDAWWFSLITAAPAVLTTPPGVQALMKDWQDAFFKTMQDRMQVLMGDAPPQPTAGSSIQQNMDPNWLRQLSPSGDREASWAQHKFGTKRVDGCSKSWSPTGDVSEASRDGRSLLCQLRDSSASSSSSHRPSTPSKRLRADRRSPVCRSYSQDDRWQSPVPVAIVLLLNLMRAIIDVPQLHTPNVVGQKDRFSLSRWPSPAGMTRRPARNVSLSPRRRSLSHPAQWSSRGRHTSPRNRRMSPNHRSHYSSSRSLTLRPRRRHISHSRSPRSRLSDWDRQRRLHEADQRLLRLRDVSPVPQQDEDLDTDQNSTADDSQLSAEAVKKLFDDSLCPPALSHSADPCPATVSGNNLESRSKHSDSLQRRRPHTSSSPPGVTQPQQAIRRSSSCEIAPGLPSHRRSEWHLVTGLLQSPLSGSQARSIIQTNHRSQEVKSIFGHTFFQNGYSFPDHRSSTTTRMDYQDKTQRCISSYPGPCEHPQVLLLCYSWKDLPVPCTPVWSLDGTPRVYLRRT